MIPTPTADPPSRASEGKDSGVIDDAGSSSRAITRRVHLRAFTERPAWGILNVTSAAGWVIQGWSFGHQLMPSLIGEKVACRGVL